MKLEDIDIDEIFQRSFTAVGTCIAECYCGRTHVATHSPYFDDGEEKELQMWIDRAEHDDQVLLFDCDSIAVIEVGGRRFAEDCECKGWAPYRDFIFQHRKDIKHFLIRLAEEAQIALEMERTFNVLKEKKMKVLDEPEF